MLFIQMIPTVSNNKFIYKPVTIQHDQGLNVYWQGKWQNIPDGDVSIVELVTNTVSGTNPKTIEVTSPFQSTVWYLYNMNLNNFSKVERITSPENDYCALYYNNTYATGLQLSTPYSGYVQFLAEDNKISITADSIVDIDVYRIKSPFV